MCKFSRMNDKFIAMYSGQQDVLYQLLHLTELALSVRSNYYKINNRNKTQEKVK